CVQPFAFTSHAKRNTGGRAKTLPPNALLMLQRDNDSRAVRRVFCWNVLHVRDLIARNASKARLSLLPVNPHFRTVFTGLFWNHQTKIRITNWLSALERKYTPGSAVRSEIEKSVITEGAVRHGE